MRPRQNLHNFPMVLRKTDPVRTTWRNGSPPSFARPFLTLPVRLRCALHSFLLFVATLSESSHLDNERETTGIDGRFLRLEKTVEALSHGLILALTQLKCESGGRSGDVPRAELHGASGTSASECDEEEEDTPGDATTSLSRTLARMELVEKSAVNFYATSSALVD